MQTTTIWQMPGAGEFVEEVDANTWYVSCSCGWKETRIEALTTALAILANHVVIESGSLVLR